MITSAEFAQHYVPKLEKVIRTNIDKQIKQGDHKIFFAEGSTSHKYEDTRIEEATGPARAISEGALVPKIGLNDGHVKRRHVSEYGCRVEWTKMVRKTGDSKLMGRIAKIGGDSPNQLISDLVCSYVELGDQSTSAIPLLNGRPMIDTTCADRLPIFHTAHTFKSSSQYTYANKASAYTDLTADSLWDIFNEIGLWRNNVGQLMRLRAKKVVVGTTNHKKIVELLKSSDDSETANRSTNSLREIMGPASYEVYYRMTNPDEWFVETDADNDYRLDYLYKPETERGYDERTRVHFVVVDFAVMHGVADPRRWYAVKA